MRDESATPSVLHGVRAEYEDRDWDQLVGWIVVCDCGEKFDHISPDGARAAQQYHADEEERREQRL